MKLTYKNKQLDLSSPKIMGILNVTPDSFSDGGQWHKLDAALYHAESLLKAGADILDIGGESTRPNADEVTEQIELERVIPVINAIHQRFDCWISVDTSKAIVMREAVNAGADLINDVRALQMPNALQTAATMDVPVCLMHMQGQPKTMQIAPKYQNIIQDIDDFFCQRISDCEQAGIQKDRLILDVGFGFGKTLENNYHILANLAHFSHFNLPLLVGMSRKSMISNLLNKAPNDVLSGSLACAAIAAMKGAQIIRVHDVKETADLLCVIKAMNDQSMSNATNIKNGEEHGRA